MSKLSRLLVAQLAGTAVGVFIILTSISSFKTAGMLWGNCFLAYIFTTFPILACSVLFGNLLMPSIKSVSKQVGDGDKDEAKTGV